MNKITKLCLIISMLGLASCSGNYYKIPQPALNSSMYQDMGQASETATGISLFGFIPIQDTDKIERAIQGAIAKKNGDSMTNIHIRERWYWAYILNLHKIDVRGTVLRTK